MGGVENVYLNTNEHYRAEIKVETRDARFIEWCQKHYPLHRYERIAPIISRLRSIKSKIEIDENNVANKIEVQVDDEHSNKIILDEKRNLGIVLGYPTLKNYDYGKGKIDTQQIELMFTILVDCIDHVFEGDKIYPAKDSTKKELREFLEGLPQEAFIKIRKFFETMPVLKHEIEVTNPKTNVKSKVVLTGISDFFE
jgi:hypothetical protein